MIPLSAPRNRRSQFLLAILLFLLLFAYLFGPTVRREFLAWLVVRSEVPGSAAVEELVQSYPDPILFISSLWDTGKVGHRQAAIYALRTRAARGLAADSRTEKLLLAGAQDPDMSVREAALSALAEHGSAQLVAAAQAQLTNPDPEMRLVGVQYLGRAGLRAAAPILVRMLDDSDLRVVTTAEMAFKRWTGIDFGVRIAHAFPRGVTDGSELPDVATLETIKAGVERRKSWWALHQQEYGIDALPGIVRTVTAAESGGPAADFTLPNLAGESVSLFTFHGKTVVLNFWATWCAACMSEVPDLIELQKRHPAELVVLGISLDGVRHAHGHGHSPDEDEDESKGPSLQSIRSGVARVASAKGITYPILLDPRNSVGRRFNVSELPTNVLIDSDGQVRRRFVGVRPLLAWEAMVAELSKSK